MKKVLAIILVVVFTLFATFVGLTSSQSELDAADYPHLPIWDTLDSMLCIAWCHVNTQGDPDMYEHLVWDCVEYQNCL